MKKKEQERKPPLTKESPEYKNLSANIIDILKALESENHRIVFVEEPFERDGVFIFNVFLHYRGRAEVEEFFLVVSKKSYVLNKLVEYCKEMESFFPKIEVEVSEVVGNSENILAFLMSKEYFSKSCPYESFLLNFPGKKLWFFEKMEKIIKFFHLQRFLLPDGIFNDNNIFIKDDKIYFLNFSRPKEIMNGFFEEQKKKDWQYFYKIANKYNFPEEGNGEYYNFLCRIYKTLE